ncbi:hypothetical protein [Streptomyces sp. 3211]|uniref:hypothetical protein n=1 Tax=Streptomyces sp. 3211 TaxID=1964449 RepID=UPI0009A4900B|nr:hypothetical protein [Streptomyces sp. 3211]
MNRSIALVAAGAIAVLLNPAPTVATQPAFARTSSSVTAPRGLLSEDDAERILGIPVEPLELQPEAVPDLPECPAYALLAKKFDQRVAYAGDGQALSEFVTYDGEESPVLDDLRKCSKGTEPGGTVIKIDTVPAPGGLGNLDATFTRADSPEPFHMVARVADDGSNIEIMTTGNAEQAKTAMKIALARYNGTPVP